MTEGGGAHPVGGALHCVLCVVRRVLPACTVHCTVPFPGTSAATPCDYALRSCLWPLYSHFFVAPAHRALRPRLCSAVFLTAQHTAHCMLYHCMLYTVYYILYTVYSILYVFTLHSLMLYAVVCNCMLYAVYYMIACVWVYAVCCICICIPLTGSLEGCATISGGYLACASVARA